MPTGSFQKGENVEVWSQSKGTWIPGATILEAPQEPCTIDGYAIPAGAVKIMYSAGTKWIMPEDVPKHIRRTAPFAPPPRASTGGAAPLCKFGCGRPVQPGLTRGLKQFDTCCKKCAISNGGGEHDHNCGGIAGEEMSSASTVASDVNVRRWLDTILCDDGLQLQRHVDQIYASVAGAAEKIRLEDAWLAMEAKLLGPIGEPLYLQEVERQEVLRIATSSRRKWSISRGSYEPVTVDLEVFKDMCRVVLARRRSLWFPVKMPAKTQYFVRKNPLKIEDVYSFGAKLGEGSFGIVHSVHCKVSGEHRVCKRIAKQKGREGMKTEEIMQEIDSMARLDHPNIIKVYEYFEDRNSITQVMEPCGGGELQHKIDAVFRHKKEQMYSEAFICDVTKQTLRALAFIHGQRFLHKDLKPQNIMLVEPAQPGADSATIKVIDFGLAELFSKDQMVSSQFGGTLLYMAPEVLRVELTMKSDIWSVGVILFNLITGDYPFIAQWPLPPGKNMEWWQSEVGRLIQDMNIGYKAHPQLRSGAVSPECLELMGMMLTKNHAQRPDSEACLNHMWFKKFEKRMPLLSVGVTQCLEAYSAMPELKKTLFLLIAHQSTAPAQAAALQELRSVFTQFDVRNRGALSEDDLRLVLRRSGISPLKAERIVYALDRDDSGAISWTEFTAAAMCLSVCHNKKLVAAAFNIFDTNGHSRVYEKDLLAVLGQGGPSWKEHLSTFCQQLSDRPRHGFTQEHFVKYMGSFIATSGGDQLRAVSAG
mmetsp:Transcript_42972/g.124273  ORF Transcript_42972/g.124273 Transcript_42972/m.124273 type:complete len:760 (+) Transcript_42972:101-2380(+)